jgi:MULE transposase domain
VLSSRLSESDTWWMDGTFSVVPAIFAQLYTIHVKVNDEFMPHLWCLLPDKHLNTYTRLFQILQAEALKINCVLNPTTVHIDFEMAVITAVRAQFGIEPSGCLFHFNQSLLRHMASNGLQTPYNTNNPPEVRKTVRRLMALPLVPPLRIDQAFQAVAANAPPVPGMVDMVNYVRDTYIDPQRALFDRAVWNCYNMKDRTTNSCEAYHRVINEFFHHRHPDPFRFCRFVQDQEMELERRIGQLNMGAPAKKRRPVYVLVDDALTRLRNMYFGARIPSVNALMMYMDAVAHQLYDVKH